MIKVLTFLTLFFSMFKNYLFLSLAFCGFYLTQSQAQSNWTTHYENEDFSIAYRVLTCEDTVNDINFDYYVLKLTNKTSNSLLLRYELGAGEQEAARQYRLAPEERVVGTCNSSSALQLFYRERNSEKGEPFILTNIKSYEN